MRVDALGDSAVVLTLGEATDDATLERVRAVSAAIGRHHLRGVVDVIAAFATVIVHYDLPHTDGFAALCGELEKIAADTDAALVSLPPRPVVEIPVCYGGEFGPDLGELAARARQSVAAAIALHHGADYLVHAIGFAPGFAYLGGLPEKLHAPRRATPRPRIAPGTVGIGGAQTGVYPLATPGGWNLIGRTPARMFDPRRAPPALLHAGDRVRFRPISAEAFELLEAASRTEAAPAAPTPGVLGEVGHAVGDHFPITVGRAGMATTLQDLGRTGHRASGVPLSGAADATALRVANLLAGNPEDAAALECNVVGPDLAFAADTVVALGGAGFEGLPPWEPLRIQKGMTLRLGAARRGARGYLAVAGGFEVEPILGSRSTYVRAALGGLEGRALRAGDQLWAQAGPRVAPPGHWRIDERVLPPYSEAPTVRVVAAAQTSEFGRELFTQEYRMGAQSDRMGAQLSGPALRRAGRRELGSAAVVPGTIQVPPDGQPIILLADAQTLGGYPQIAHVVSVDLPLVAQLRPGDRLRFREVSLTEAHAAWREREHGLAMLRQGLAQKFASPEPKP